MDRPSVPADQVCHRSHELLELPGEILTRVLRLVPELADGPLFHSHTKLGGLQAFRCVSQAARAAADAAVEFVVYDDVCHRELRVQAQLGGCSGAEHYNLVEGRLVKELARWPGVSRVHLCPTSLPPSCLGPITAAVGRSCGSLKELGLSGEGLETLLPGRPRKPVSVPLSLEELSRCRFLERLSLTNMTLQQSALTVIAALPHLQILCLRLLNKGPLEVPPIPQLRKLLVVGPEVKTAKASASFHVLRLKMETEGWALLETLVLRHCALEVRANQPCLRLPGSLRVLTLFNMENRQLLDLSLLTGLKRLYVIDIYERDNRVQLASLPNLQFLTTLQTLTVRGFEAASLPGLEELTALEVLTLSSLLLVQKPRLECLVGLRTLVIEGLYGVRDSLSLPVNIESLRVTKALLVNMLGALASCHALREICTDSAALFTATSSWISHLPSLERLEISWLPSVSLYFETKSGSRKLSIRGRSQPRDLPYPHCSLKPDARFAPVAKALHLAGMQKVTEILPLNCRWGRLQSLSVAQWWAKCFSNQVEKTFEFDYEELWELCLFSC